MGKCRCNESWEKQWDWAAKMKGNIHKVWCKLCLTEFGCEIKFVLKHASRLRTNYLPALLEKFVLVLQLSCNFCFGAVWAVHKTGG